MAPEFLSWYADKLAAENKNKMEVLILELHKSYYLDEIKSKLRQKMFEARNVLGNINLGFEENKAPVEILEFLRKRFPAPRKL